MAKLFWTGKERFRFVTTLGLWLEAALAALLWSLLSVLPWRRAVALGRRSIGGTGPHLAKHQHVLANLRMVCPGQSEGQIQQTGRDVWSNLGAVLADVAHLRDIVGSKAQPSPIEVVCLNSDADFLAASRPCIFVAAHLGNWYLSVAGIRQAGYPVDVVYSPLSNPFLDRMMQARLQALECGFITKQNAARPMLKALKNGRSIGLHVDVRVDGGELFPLCGANATTTTAPAWLAQKTGCPIVPIQVKRSGDNQFRVTIFPALPAAAPGLTPEQAIRRMTEDMNAAICELIRDNPRQWLCTKRRWPKDTMQQRGAY
ncbi:MAG: lysophospholipid acyltransferase family protein [Thiogranum sp.]|nr:lysophospholipid acyltransferase family protein [Thiogranum sp.]